MEKTIAEYMKEYEQIGYQVLMTFKDDPSFDEKIAPLLKGKITVLAGQSGVGKSTLLNTIITFIRFKNRCYFQCIRPGKTYN